MSWLNTDKRERLWPALSAMKSLVSQPGRRYAREGFPNWEEECDSLGINPATVRQWKRRTEAEHERERRSSPASVEYRLELLTEVVLKLLDSLGETEEQKRLTKALTKRSSHQEKHSGSSATCQGLWTAAMFSKDRAGKVKK
jgi:hypothetical protein